MWKRVGATALSMAVAWPSVAQTQWPSQEAPVYTPATFVRMQDAYWFAPRTVEFVRRVEGLQQALDTHCQGGLVIPVRQAWRDAMVAWGRLSTVSVGTMLERNSPERIDAQPARADLLEALLAKHELPDLAQVDKQAQGFAALEWLLWMQPPQPRLPAASRTTRGARGKSAVKPAKTGKTSQTLTQPGKQLVKQPPKTGVKPAAAKKAALNPPQERVVGAYALYGARPMLVAYTPPAKPVAKTAVKPGAKPLAKTANKSAGKSAAQRGKGRRGASAGAAAGAPPAGLAAATASRTTSQPAACKLAQALAAQLHDEAMKLAEGLAKRLDAPVDAPGADQRLKESLAQWLAGVELLRVHALDDPLQNKSDKPRARAELPRLLSGSSALDRQARWSQLRALAVFEGVIAPVPDTALIPFETWLRSRAQHALAEKLHAAVLNVDHALEAALPNTPETLLAAGQALAALHELALSDVVPALSSPQTPAALTPAPASASEPASASASAVPGASAPESAASAPKPTSWWPATWWPAATSKP